MFLHRVCEKVVENDMSKNAKHEIIFSPVNLCFLVPHDHIFKLLLRELPITVLIVPLEDCGHLARGLDRGARRHLASRQLARRVQHLLLCDKPVIVPELVTILVF